MAESKPVEKVRELMPEQEDEFLQKQIVGQTVTAAHFCQEHGLILTFGDWIRLEVPEGDYLWRKRAKQ
jgi:hypothetical protein